MSCSIASNPRSHRLHRHSGLRFRRGQRARRPARHPTTEGCFTVDELAALITAMFALTQDLRRTLTWDQGAEMPSHDKIVRSPPMASSSLTSASPDSAGPTRTGTAFRQYFPKHTNLALHIADDLAAVACQSYSTDVSKLSCCAI